MSKTVGAPTKYAMVVCPKCHKQIGLTYMARHTKKCEKPGEEGAE